MTATPMMTRRIAKPRRSPTGDTRTASRLPTWTPATASVVKVQLSAAANAPPGQYPITVTGKAKHKNKDFSISAAAVQLVLTK